MYRYPICGLVVALAVLFCASTGGANSAHTPRCPAAAIADVELPAHAHIDEIRVVVADSSPDGAQMTVRVDDGHSDRVLRVLGGGTHGLKFSPALTSTNFAISLVPVFEAPGGACIEQVQLLTHGTAVAVVTP